MNPKNPRPCDPDPKSEDRIQQDIFIYLNNNFCLEHHPARGIVFHVPNQRINKLERIKLASIGVLSGVSDLIFIYKGKHLYLEVKTPAGRQDPAQREFEGRIQANGFSYYLVRSVPEVHDILHAEFGVTKK